MWYVRTLQCSQVGVIGSVAIPLYVVAGQSNAVRIFETGAFEASMDGRAAGELGIVSAENGQSLFPSEQYNDFYPFDDGNPNTGELYRDLVDAIGAELAANSEVHLAGVFWLQGEEDATSTTYGPDYYTNLDQLHQNLVDLFGGGFDFVISALSTYIEGASIRPAWSDVRQAQEDMANTHEGVYLVDPDDLIDVAGYSAVEVFDDEYHYTQIGYEWLADSFFDLFPLGANIAPVAADDGFAVDEDALLSGNVLADNGGGADSDLDGDPLTVNTTPVSDVSHGTLVLNGDGSFSYTPDAHFNGSDSFVYEISDNNGGTDTATAFVTVNPVNDAPVLTSPPVVAHVENQTPVTTLTATDADGDTLTFAIAGGADAGLFLVDPATGALGFRTTPFFAAPQDANGDNVYELVITATDGTEVSAPQALSIQVGAGSFNQILGTGLDDLDLVGTAAADHIIGLAGNDRMNGQSGGDWLEGREGNDKLYGSNGDDLLQGGDGDDYLMGVNGADIMDGGAGTDTASWKFSPVAIDVNLALGTVSGGTGDGDILISIENIEGSRDHGDTLTGDDGNNRIYARGGNDTVSGGLGTDRLYGEAGDDTLLGGGDDDVLLGGIGADMLDGGAGTADWAGYYQSTAAVTVDLNLAGPQVSTGEASGDTLINIENLQGSNFDDVLTGDGVSNRFYGLIGNDVLNGGGGDDKLYGGTGVDTINGGDDNDLLVGGAGADSLDGGAGIDSASYAGSGAAVQVDLGTGLGTGGEAEGDSLTGVEDVVGSGFADTLTGDGGANRLTGNGGDDTLGGGGGDDKIYGGSGADRINGGADKDYLVGGGGADTFVFDPGWGYDTIGDYQQGVDILDLSGTGLIADDLSIVDAGNGHTLVVDMTTGLNKIRLDNTDWTQVSTADFFFGP